MKRTGQTILAPLYAILLFMTCQPGVQAQTASIREPPMNYCGLFCVYAVAKERGVDVAFESLVDADLLTGRYGSSVGNIVEALDRCGIDGHPRAGMNMGQLSSLTKPALLHVTVPIVGNSYRHWVLFLGRDTTGNIRIYDPPSSEGTLSEAELLSVWDGVAVLTELPSLETRMPDVRFIGLGLLAVVGACVVGRWMNSGSLVLCLVAIVCVSASLVPGTGILTAPLAVGSVQARFFNDKFPEVDYAGLKQFMSEPHVLIDARPTKAFAYSHIPGSINIPVNSGFVAFCSAARALKNNVPVILYCQSERCGWGDKVANQLRGRGVKNIRIYRGGMNEWLSQEP